MLLTLRTLRVVPIAWILVYNIKFWADFESPKCSADGHLPKEDVFSWHREAVEG
jgi:hypothetical protein